MRKKSYQEYIPLVSLAVAKLKLYPSIFKYLTFKNGIEMLKNSNIQYTRASELNDPNDCHISKVNFDCLKEVEDIIDIGELTKKIYNKHENTLNSFGICSFGTSSDNPELWNKYAKSDGICIELDTKKTIDCLIKKSIASIGLEVEYLEHTENTIPYKYFISKDKELKFLFLQRLFSQKTMVWAQEKEVRLILPQTLENEYYRTEIYKSCFKGVYLGKGMSEGQISNICNIISETKYKLKIY